MIAYLHQFSKIGSRCSSIFRKPIWAVAEVITSACAAHVAKRSSLTG